MCCQGQIGFKTNNNKPFVSQSIDKEDSHKSYRPITTLSFRISHVAAGGRHSAFSMHLENILMHCLATLLLYRLLSHFFPPSASHQQDLVLATLLFAAHPIHTEAVSGIVGRSEPLCAIFFFTALLFFWTSANLDTTRLPAFAMSLFSVACAVLSKETGLTCTVIFYLCNI